MGWILGGVIALLIITFVPQLVTFLPGILMG